MTGSLSRPGQAPSPCGDRRPVMRTRAPVVPAPFTARPPGGETDFCGAASARPRRRKAGILIKPHQQDV
ncbi:hypothetical protein AZ28_3660 [Bordetella pertussis B200]|nr:hypothetical protein AZ28_3660 [Bordetella pertussis B200]